MPFTLLDGSTDSECSKVRDKSDRAREEGASDEEAIDEIVM